MQNIDYLRYTLKDRALDDISKFNSNAMLVYADEMRTAADRMWEDYTYARKHINATPKLLRGIAKERYEDGRILDSAIALDKATIAFEALSDFLKIHGDKKPTEPVRTLSDEDIDSLKKAVNTIETISRKIKKGISQ